MESGLLRRFILFCLLIDRCGGQHGGEDAASGVCPEQEESSGPEEPKPLHAQ